MNKTKTIYAASSGEYSDYGVDCLFETKEDAEIYVKEGHSKYVEEFEYNLKGFRAKATLLYRVIRSGWFPEEVIQEENWLNKYMDGNYKRPKISIFDHRNNSRNQWSVNAACIDKEAAIKACADRAMPFELEEGRIPSAESASS